MLRCTGGHDESSCVCIATTIVNEIMIIYVACEDPDSIREFQQFDHIAKDE